LKFDNFTAGCESMVTSVKGKILNTQNLAVFATYSERTLDQSDKQVLADLRSAGFGICIVVNVKNAVTFDYTEYADVVILRKNVGLDLAAVRDALKILGSDWHHLILINDSVVWPEGNFQRVISAVLNFNEEFAVLGLIDSFQRTHHVQSFFLAANQHSVKELFYAYMKFKNWRFKRSIVTFGEIPIKFNLHQVGISILPLISYRDLEAAYLLGPSLNNDDVDVKQLLKEGVALNPTQHLWRMLLANDFGCLKRSLVRDNPANLQYPPVYPFVSGIR
jgi:hypothetical protein